MNDLNEVIEIGRLTRNLDERDFGYTKSGVAKATICIAVNRSRKNGDEWVKEVSYFDIQIWGKMAENLKPYLKKGKQISVSGYLKQDRWEKDGQTRSKVYIVADEIQLLGGNSENNNSGKNTSTNAYSQSANASQPNDENAFASSFSNGDFPEDIPF